MGEHITSTPAETLELRQRANREAQPVGIPMTERLLFLDVMRAIAAISVFVVHIGASVSADFKVFTYNTFDLGQFGVHLFFICSGFIIPASIARTGSIRQFWINRFFRLYPLYWFSIAVALVYRLLFIGTTDGVELDEFGAALAQAPVSTIIANLTMVQGFLGVPHANGLYWTLSYEMLFYIISSLLFLLKFHNRTTQFTLLWLLTIYLVGIGTLLAGQHVMLSSLHYLSVILFGTVVYQIFHRKLSTSAGIVITALAFGAWGLTAWTDSSAWAGTLPAMPRILERIGACSVFLIACQLAQRRWPGWLTYLGKISYSFYLIHPFVYASIPPLGPRFLTVGVWLLATIIVSSLTYRYIEQPGIELGRRLRGAYRLRMQASAAKR